MPAITFTLAQNGFVVLDDEPMTFKEFSDRIYDWLILMHESGRIGEYAILTPASPGGDTQPLRGGSMAYMYARKE